MSSAPLSLADVIAQIESGNDPRRLRFEPKLHEKWMQTNVGQREILLAIYDANSCSWDTARMIACTSWGRYQILGLNIYSGQCGWFKTTIVDFINSDAIQRDCFDHFLRAKGIDFTIDELVADRTKREQFITQYNGPGMVDVYWARMQKVIG